MTKKELSEKTTRRIIKILPNITPIEVEIILKSIIHCITEETLNGGTVYLRGFGTIGPKWRKPKKAQNIRKKELIFLEGYYRPFFKPAKEYLKAMKSVTEKIKTNQVVITRGRNKPAINQ